MGFLDFLFRRRSPIQPDPMKYLITGLGNPGADYDLTRHNIGFEILDHMAEANGVEWRDERLGWVTEFKHKGRTFVLLKPTTFMNRSGKAVNHWLQKLKIKQQNLLVIVDDLNLPYGKQRLRSKGSHGGHNGLRDIQDVLARNDYARLRIGIGDNFSKGQQVDYVLGKWTDKELDHLEEVKRYAAETVKAFGTIGMERAMSNYNGKAF